MTSKTTPISSLVLRCCALMLPISGAALADNGTWTSTTSGGNWSTPGNWAGTTVADGSGFTADFSTIEITADMTVHLDSPRGITSVKFGDTTTGTAGSWTLDNNGNAANILNLTGTSPTINVNALGTGKTATISAEIGGSGGLSKTGAGRLILSGTNTYGGGTTVTPVGDTTSVTVANSSAFGSSAGAVLLNGPNTFSAGINVNTGLSIANALTLKPTARAVLGLNGTASWSGNITVDGSASAGLAVVAAGGTNATTTQCTVGGTVTHTGANANFFVLRGSNQFGKVTGSISYGTGTVQLLDNCTWEFSNAANTWGLLDVNHAGATAYAGAANTLASSGSAGGIGTLKLNNLAKTTAFDQTVAGLGGSLKVGLDTGSATLTLNTPADKTCTGAISGAINLVKSGAAVQTLSGFSTYTGTTTINGGTLKIGSGGSIASSPSIILGGGNLDVVAGGGFLGASQGISGNGTVLGTVSTDSASVIRPGTIGVAGTLAFNNDLSMTTGSLFEICLGSSATSGNSKVTVAGALTLDSTVFNINAADLMPPGGALAPATYTLASAGSIVGSPSGTAVNWVGTPPSNAGAFTLEKSGNSIVLKYASPVVFGAITATPSQAVRSQNVTITAAVSDALSTSLTVKVDATPVGGPANVTLTQTSPGSGIYSGSFAVGTGSVGGNHALTITATDHLSNVAQSATTVNIVGAIWSGLGPVDPNWSSPANWLGGVLPLSGEPVIFAGSLPASLLSELDGSYSLSSLTFNNGTGAFTITDSSFSQTLTLSGGITNLSANTQTLDVALVLGAPQTIRATAGDITLNREVTGSGGIALEGPHTLTLAAPNSYDGTTTLVSGTLMLGAPSAIPSGPGKGNLLLNGGDLSAATLDLNGYNQTLNGLVGSLGVIPGKVTNNFAAPVTLTLGAADASSTFEGQIEDNTGAGGVIALTKIGNGALALAGNNTYSGGTTNSGGTILCTQSDSLGTGALTCSGGQWVALASGVTFAHDIVMNAGGGNFSGLVKCSSGTATLEGGTITINGNPGSGGHLAADPGCTLIVKDPVNYVPATGSFIWRTGTGIFSGGGSYPGMAVTGTVILGANDGLATNAIVAIGNSGVATLDLAGFNQTLAGITKPAANAATIGNSSVDTDSTLTTTGTSDFAGVIQDSVNGGTMKTRLSVSGGSLTLSGVNTYTGPTSVSDGQLSVNGSLAAASAITVSGSGVLAGTGNAAGTVSIAASAAVAPAGAGIGTLKTGTLTLAGTYQCDVDASTSDKLEVSGDLDLSGTTLAITGTPTASSYLIASYTGTLSPAAPAITGIPAGYSLDLSTAGQIKLVKPAGYDTWAASWSGLSDTTPDGDPDHDGIANLLEYVIGGDPRVSSTQFLPVQTIVGPNLVISYKRSDDSEADTTQNGQWSISLAPGSWTNVTPVLVNENAAAPDDMTITIPLSNAAGGKLFGRLNVTKP